MWSLLDELWRSLKRFLLGQAEAADLFLPAVKVDVRAKCRHNPDYAVTIEDLNEWERRHGRIPNESAVIGWTGWDARWGTPAYPNQDAAGVVHQPGFSIPAANWLIEFSAIVGRSPWAIFAWHLETKCLRPVSVH